MTAEEQKNQLTIIQIPAGPIETNAYLVIDPTTAEALVIDAPPTAINPLQAEVAQRNITPTALVVTHTHWDHIGDVAVVSQQFVIPVLIHELERDRVEHPDQAPVAIAPAKVGRTLADGDEVRLGERVFRVMHTPGHSPGQISLYSEADRALFGGDTLFPDGYGRVDLPGASEQDTLATMRRLLTLPDDVVVYPGHGVPTTIGRERRWMEQVTETGKLL